MDYPHQPWQMHGSLHCFCTVKLVVIFGKIKERQCLVTVHNCLQWLVVVKYG